MFCCRTLLDLLYVHRPSYTCTDCDGRAAPLQSRPVALITHFIFPSSSSLSAGRDSHSLWWFHHAACRRYAQNSVCVGGLFILSTNWTTLRSCRGVLHSSGPQGWFLDVAEDKNESFPLTEMNFSQNSIETNQCFFYWSSADAVCFIYIDVAELERPCQWSEVHFKGSHLFRSSSRPAGGDEMNPNAGDGRQEDQWMTLYLTMNRETPRMSQQRLNWRVEETTERGRGW